MEEVHRYLDLCIAELGGVEAKLEIGGADPDDPHLVWVTLDDGFRLVVRFESPPNDAGALRARLAAFAQSFGEVERKARAALPRSTMPPVHIQLSEMLASLAELAGAERAVVIDDSSPVLFGDSQPEGDVAPAAVKRLETAIAAVRDSPEDHRCVREGSAPHLSRSFASIYRVVLVFSEPFSEMRADGHLVRALPAIENRTLALPPLDPKGGARMRLLRPT